MIVWFNLILTFVLLSHLTDSLSMWMIGWFTLILTFVLLSEPLLSWAPFQTGRSAEIIGVMMIASLDLLFSCTFSFT
jgi:hypothetical protein